MSRWIESLEDRQLLSASALRPHWDTLPPVVAGEEIPFQMIAHVFHPTSLVIQPTVQINWGDGTKESLAAYARTETEAATNGVTHTYEKPGDYRASVTFFTGSKLAAKTTKLIHVTNNSYGDLFFRNTRAGGLNAPSASSPAPTW
ncbi:MAG TPA: hypothetical protein VN541_01740 [Tepidisphaeraceae bacterium]|nr:hypothetical protein [Tepidisphaeraceae bacterium]